MSHHADLARLLNEHGISCTVQQAKKYLYAYLYGGSLPARQTFVIGEFLA